MAIRFRLIKAANGLEYGSIVSGYRDPVTKKSTTRSLKSYGHVSQEKLADPLFLSQVRHDINYFSCQLQTEAKKTQTLTPSKVARSFLRINYSFFALRYVYEKLKCDQIITDLKAYSSIENFEDLFFYMTAERINDDECQFVSPERNHIFDFSHILLDKAPQALTFLASRAYQISRQLNKNLVMHNLVDKSNVTYYLTKLNFQHIKNSPLNGALIENQCVLGLTLDGNYIPLDYHLNQILPGDKINRDDMLSRVLYVKNTTARYASFTFVADTELNKREYIYHLEKEKCPYILCSNLYKLSVRRQSLLLKGKFKKGRSADGDSSWRYRQVKEPLTIRQFGSRIILDCKIFVIYSKSKRAHDLWRLEKQWRAASNLVDMSDQDINSTGLLDEELLSSSLMRFIKLKHSAPGLLSIDHTQYSKYGVFAGYFVVITNLESNIASIYQKLKKLWDFKESYRNPNLPDVRHGSHLNYRDLMAGHFFLANFSNIIKRSLLCLLQTKNLHLNSKQLKRAMHDNALCFVKDKKSGEYLVLKNTIAEPDDLGYNSMDLIMQALSLPVFDAIENIESYKVAVREHIRSKTMHINSSVL